MQVKATMESICNGTILIVMSLTNYEIFANTIKCQQFDLNIEGQGHGGEKLN